MKKCSAFFIKVICFITLVFSPVLRCRADLITQPADIDAMVEMGYWSPAEAAVCWAYTYPDLPCPYGTPADYGITIKGSGGSSASSSSTSGGSSAPKKASKPAGPTYSDFSDGAHQYVVTHKKALYDTYNKGRNEVGSVVKDTEVSVLGQSSNGFYHINYTAEDGTAVDGYLYYEGKDNIVTKEEYDKAWEVTNTKDATCEKDGKVTEARVDMGKPETRPRMIPMITDHYIFVDQSLVLRETSIVGTDNKTYKEKFFFNGTAVSMGNPHFIVFVKDVDALDLEDLGPQFEHHKLFPEGVNTEFAQIIDENTVKFRVWERGSGETLACGTGACAVTYACMKLKKAGAMNKPLNVQARGGLLKVTYSSENDHIYLQGPAVEVFMGEIEIPDCEL